VVKSATRPLKYLLHWFVIGMALTACRPEDDKPLRVGLVVWPPYEIAYLAEDLGYFDDVGIELIDYGSPAEFVVAFQAGSLDAAGTVLDYALELQLADPRQKIVLMIDHSMGADAVVARAPARTMADLKGKRVGYEASALGGYVLSRALEANDMTPDDLILVPTDVQNQEAAFRAGEIDGVVTYEPLVTGLRKDGHAVVFDSTQIPFEIFDVLLTHADLSEAKQQKLHMFMHGWFKAMDYFHANPEEAAQRVIAREGITQEDFLATFDGVDLIDRDTNLQFLSGAMPELFDVLSRHRDKMMDLGILASAPEIDTMIDAQFVESVRK